MPCKSNLPSLYVPSKRISTALSLEDQTKHFFKSEMSFFSNRKDPVEARRKNNSKYVIDLSNELFGDIDQIIEAKEKMAKKEKLRNEYWKPKYEYGYQSIG